MTVSQEAIVTNAMEAIRQYMEEEPAHELADLDAHDLALVTTTFAVNLPAEGNVGLVEIEQAAVGDSDPMGVACEIGQKLLWPGEGLLRVHPPFDAAQRRESDGKGRGFVEIAEIAKELQFTSVECCRQAFEEEPPKQAGEHANREKESGPAGDPTLAVGRDAAARNDAVKMRVQLESLAPGV